MCSTLPQHMRFGKTFKNDSLKATPQGFIRFSLTLHPLPEADVYRYLLHQDEGLVGRPCILQRLFRLLMQRDEETCRARIEECIDAVPYGPQ